MAQVDLSILIINWNTHAFLTQCLQSLHHTADRLVQVSPELALLAYGPHHAEVIVVDNASTDESVEIVRQRFPWARLLANERNVGFAPANNQAYGYSTGRYVLLLNSDTEVHPRALRTLIDFMDSHAQCAACGARLLNADRSLQASCQPMLTPWREFWQLTFLDQLWQRSTYPMAKWSTYTARPVETIKGACLLVRRSALETGQALLDERYFMYTEEVDLCYRLARAGWILYWVPEACVTHYGEASSRQAYTPMYVQLYRSKVQFFRKFGGESRARLFKQLIKLAYWPRWIAARIVQTVRPSLANRVYTFRQLLEELPRM